MMLMMNAANMAYSKAISTTRDRNYLAENHPEWMSYFADMMPERLSRPDSKHLESELKRKQRVLLGVDHWYTRMGWVVYQHFFAGENNPFEVFILANIVLAGVSTGLDLEFRGDPDYPNAGTFVSVVTAVSTVVFTLEVVLKVIAEGFEPWFYFTSPSDGSINTMDFTIVFLGYGFMLLANPTMSGVVRLLRLIRLLTFVKGVPQLRVIVSGLVNGMGSVSWIVLLLILIIYLFAIMGCLFFGANDPARFGTVSQSMLSLFHISTLASWTGIAYTSWYGCGVWGGDPYAAADHPTSKIQTLTGQLAGFQCKEVIASPVTTFFFFTIYVIITAWVVLSLFIGVMSMGMFEAFQEMQEQQKQERYIRQLEENDAGDEDESDSKEEEETAKAESSSSKLRDLIQLALEDKHAEYVPKSELERLRLRLQSHSLAVRDSTPFVHLVVATIVAVGVHIGIETDAAMHCARRKWRLESSSSHASGVGAEDGAAEARESFCDHGSPFGDAVGLTAQVVFTFECVVKILAEGLEPSNYFTDAKDGAWNKLDFFIVILGLLELSPAAAIIRIFPVVVLRLLRLLRVFRLAKALPRLRSIVDALMSGMSSVGWICVLFAVFNYIVGCAGMVFLKESDPFHFGSIGRSMFTVLRIETLDSWDQILYITMYGCAGYPAGYSMVNKPGLAVACTGSVALGWIGALVLFSLVIMGSYILPTVLIGIVSISFDEANRRASALQEMQEKMIRVQTLAKEDLPDFFSPGRMDSIRAVFDHMDADGGLVLDVNEMGPFYTHAFDMLFQVVLSKDQTEALFHLMDMDGDAELANSACFHLGRRARDGRVRAVRRGGEKDRKEVPRGHDFQKKCLPHVGYEQFGRGRQDQRRAS